MPTGPTGTPEQPECILCGRCLEVCPLFAATGREELSPRGKSFLMAQALEQGNLADPGAARRLLGLCLGCGRCAAACPQGRDLPGMLRRVRQDHPGWQAWVWRAWITQARRLWPWVGAVAGVIPGRGDPGSVTAGLKALAGKPSAPAMIRRTERSKGLPGSAMLFPGCVARWAKPWWIDAPAALAGIPVSGPGGIPDWGCCGFALGQAGLVGLRLDLCRGNLDLWRARGRPLVLTVCTTCLAALRSWAEEPDFFADEAEKTLWLHSAQPLSGFLDPGDFAPAAEGSGVLFHRPCHAPQPDPDLALLRGILGPDLRESAANACCGMGGVMRLCAPDLSGRVGAWHWAAFGPDAPRRVVSGCSGCVVQLSASAPEHVAVSHWLDLFAQK